MDRLEKGRRDRMANGRNVSIVRRMSMETYMVRIYTGPLSQDQDFISVEAEKVTTADDVVRLACSKMRLPEYPKYELAEVFSTAGQLCKERRLGENENPVRIQLLWPKIVNADYDRGGSGTGYTGYRFYIRRKNLENSQRTSAWMEYADPNPVDNFLTAFLKQPTNNKEYSDLCNLPDLNERTLLENIKSRFQNSNIYTYVGSILIAVNPFKFFPIYNPKYVKMYQNRRLGDLPPHIFAIADAAFYTMLRTKRNQCIVISGESGSGKTESTNLLLHHLTALSHKGLHGSGVEQTILGAGPVLEAFGNAKTVHNNNSSRFGKFIQVNYKENGMVHGAIVEKYLLEKSRIVSQASNERNYHVFYYLLEGAEDLEREKLHLGKPEDYFYLRQSDCYKLEEVDEANEFSRLKQSMEMVGFSHVTQKRIFGVLSAVLHLGNVQFKKKGDQHHDESVTIVNPDAIDVISQLLMVKERTLVEALTQKKTIAGDETVVMTHRMEHAVATRDAMAKCLYGALFDWIVLKVNQALLAKRHNSEHQDDDDSTENPDYVRHTGNSIGVLDIFGFEDFRWNSFEQFCINYANEHLQYYFNQHIFKFEQEEYKKEGIQWKNIEFIDNTGCLELFSKKSNGLFSLLDEECNFPGASNETLLTKFHHHHSKGNVYYEAPQKREMAFTVVHYAGKVKYQTKDFREKNSDQIRTDIVANLKSSSLSFVRELMGVDPVAVLRWTIVKTLIKSMFAFVKAGKTYRSRGGPDTSVVTRRKQSSGDYLNIPDLGSSHFLSPSHCSPIRSPTSPMHDNTHATGNNDDLRNSGGLLRSPVDPYLSEDEVRVMRRATKVLMKNKSFKPKTRPQTMFSDIKTLKAIANRTIYIGGKGNSKQKSPSVGAQFQWSLSRLMSTLNQANPFFIRCIKSNAEKLPCRFDDILVLRQLRYTGMLATVRIRQSGYNYRLTFEEFVQLYKILLPKGLESGEKDVSRFLDSMNKNSENYQIGKTKVFLRETEKLLIDEYLHCAIMKRVITLQRWVKTKVERKNYLQLRENTIFLQKHVRSFLARRQLEIIRDAVLFLQRVFRGYRVRRSYMWQRKSAIRIQAHVKGHLCRKRYRELETQREIQDGKKSEDMHSSTSDEGVLLKDNSTDDLDIPKARFLRGDSEDSSGILDDSESDTLLEGKSRGDSVGSPPPTPTSTPEIKVESLGGHKDDYLTQSKRSSRVQGLTKHFQTPERDTSYSDDIDGRPDTGMIFVRRGSGARKRPAKMSPAPLAKQESFSDLESPTTSSGSLLISPETRRQIEESLRKPGAQELQLSAEDVRRSPLKQFMKGARHLVAGSGGRKKKDSAADDSEEEEAQASPLSKHLQNIGGVAVLPVGPLSPHSPQPKDEATPVFPPAFDQDDKKIPKKRRTRKAEKDKENRPMETQQKGWNVEKTSKWQYPEEFVIQETWEVLELDRFIKDKIQSLSKDTGKKESQFDVVFMNCLKLFHTELKTLLAVHLQFQITKEGTVITRYRDLFASFEGTMDAVCKQENVNTEVFPVTLCINAFRGYLDEFRNSAIVKNKSSKYRKKQFRPNKREKLKKDIIEHQGHKFSQTQFGIPTFCELCSNIIWIMEKGHVCTVCKYACHKKCILKSQTPCKGAQDPSVPRIAGTKVFGVPLASLIGPEDKVPIFMDHLIMLIETHGLYTVGIYRKSGANPKIKALKQTLDNGIVDIDITNYPIHVLTSTLKTFFRELPEPLLTYEYHEAFIQASEIQDEKEAIQVLFSLIEKLPKANHDVLERLIFHLARVAQHETSNKMSVNSIAIIFAPCLLRPNKQVQAQDLITQVTRQQICIEKILNEQLRKLKTALQDINVLESAEQTANERLSAVRASMRTNTKSPGKSKSSLSSTPSVSEESENLEEQERVINSHIESIRKEKDSLTSTLPVFEYRHSSDDEMLSADDIDSIYDNEESDFHREDLLEPPAYTTAQLRHLTKNRAFTPARRPPSNHRNVLTHFRSHSSERIANRGQTTVETVMSGLKASDQRLKTSDQELKANEQGLKASDQRMKARLLEAQRSSSPLSAMLQRETDDSEQDSDGTSDSGGIQVDALTDPPTTFDWKNKRRQELLKKHNQSKTANSSVVTTTLLSATPNKSSDRSRSSERSSATPERSSAIVDRSTTSSDRFTASSDRSTPTSDRSASSSKSSSNSEGQSLMPVDSINLAKLKGQGHVFGSSPKLRAKLTKPLKLQLDPKNRFSAPRLSNVNSDTKISESGSGLISRSLDIPENSAKNKRSLLTEGKAASCDSNFSLREQGSDSDEEIMV